jgi:hypothetical protein
MSKRMRWVRHAACIGWLRNVYKIFIRKLEGKRPHRRPRHRQKYIKMDLRETGWEDVDWMHLTQDRGQWWPLVNTVTNLWVTQKTRNFLTR